MRKRLAEESHPDVRVEEGDARTAEVTNFPQPGNHCRGRSRMVMSIYR